MKIATLEKPQGKNWRTAQRYRADFYHAKFPISGGYLVFVVLGRKWVRVTQGDLVSTDKSTRSHLPRFKMPLKEWQQMNKEKVNE